MHAMWVSMKDIAKCGSKLNDVVFWPEKCSKNRSYTSMEKKSESEFLHLVENPIRKVIIGQSDVQQRFSELNVGDPSRNIVEMIFQAASINPLKQSRKIERVLRVKNSIEIVERFEKYREMVKKKAYDQYKRHPRSMVDGNELLQFYVTTMTCCDRKPNWISELCKEPTCGVCRTIQSSFDMEYTKKNGIRLSTSSEALGETMIDNSKRMNVKRAMILCRTIAGKVVNMVDTRNEEEYDSIRSVGPCSKLEYLIVQNPSALLPCFVIVIT